LSSAASINRTLRDEGISILPCAREVAAIEPAAGQKYPGSIKELQFSPHGRHILTRHVFENEFVVVWNMDGSCRSIRNQETMTGMAWMNDGMCQCTTSSVGHRSFTHTSLFNTGVKGICVKMGNERILTVDRKADLPS
jgi:hypothetical protein